jgi:hypothetical protein
LKDSVTPFALCGIGIILIVMFLAEQDLFKGGFQNPLPAISSWYQSIEWPWTETPEEKTVRIAKENARKEQIQRNTIQQEIFVLSPGQKIRVKVGEKYKLETKSGRYLFSLFYKGNLVDSGVDGHDLDTSTNDMLVDEIVLYQDPRYPYGNVVLTLQTTPPK